MRSEVIHVLDGQIVSIRACHHPRPFLEGITRT
jgi:hypothetical protein